MTLCQLIQHLYKSAYSNSALKFYLVVISVNIIVISILVPAQCLAAVAPEQILNQFKSASAIDLIIEYDDAAIEQTTKNMRAKKLRDIDDSEIRSFKRKEYQAIKDKVDKQHTSDDIADLKNYSDLPIKFKRFKNEKALKKYLATQGVKAVYENIRLQRVLLESLPLINQPDAAIASADGAGTTVAVLDDGIDYTHPAFGSCTAANTPVATCKVVVSQDFAAVPNTANAHGTNVSAIVLGVAPAAKIAMLNVFSSDGALVSDILDAINWSISNKTTYNIQAMNLSLGGTSKFTSACTNDWSKTAVQNARNAGITVVIASGNSAFTDGIASPACAPAAISVGAVYDANLGSLDFGFCQDTTTNPDKVTCFSNSANFLTMLAPGAAITAAGITQYGTSQASPHVAGAVAVLRALYPSETLTQTQARLTSSGTSVLDTRNNISKPRLNLLAAGRPSNDTFANRITLTGASGNTTGQSAFASKEVNEPNHAGSLGGASVWWKWVATANGQLTLTTNNSGFDTVLAVYQGAAVSSLLPVTSNDNESASSTSSRVFLQAVAGREYQIAVDGANGRGGDINLAWALNTNPAANLSLSLTGPISVQLGQAANYTLTINNLGPQAATNANIVVSIPSGANLLANSSGCTLTTNVLTCLAPVVLNGESKTFNMQLVWSSLTSPATLSATLNSEVNDLVASNNTSSLLVSLNSNSGGGSQDSDVPTLPEWAAICLMSILLWQNFKVYKHRI